MNENDFEKIYETQYGWIGRIGGKEHEAFYFVTVSQGVISNKIGIRLSKSEIAKIIDSNGNSDTIASILREKQGYIEIE